MKPTLGFVPCFSGAAWDLSAFPMLQEWLAPAPVLPVLDGWAAHVAWLRAVTRPLAAFVVIGDSFGAAFALAAAAAGVPRLQAVVASGGFAMNPLRPRALRMMVRRGPHLAGAAYRHGVLPLHARLLASRYDRAGDRPWTVQDTLALFRRHTSASAYWTRGQAAVTCDLTPGLARIAVPTLLMTPEDDHLIAPASVHPVRPVPGVVERNLPKTGHMFGFSHPALYGAAVQEFLVARHFADA